MNDVSPRRSFPKSNALQDEDVKTTRSGRPFLCPETGRSNMVPSGEHVKPASTVKNRPGGRKLCSIATSLGGGFRRSTTAPPVGRTTRLERSTLLKCLGEYFLGEKCICLKKRSVSDINEKTKWCAFYHVYGKGFSTTQINTGEKLLQQLFLLKKISCLYTTRNRKK